MHGQKNIKFSNYCVLPDNTRHSQQTNIHAPGGIQTHDLSRRAALPSIYIYDISRLKVK